MNPLSWFRRSLRVQAVTLLDEILVVQSQGEREGKHRIKATLPDGRKVRLWVQPVERATMTPAWERHIVDLGLTPQQRLWLHEIVEPPLAHLVLTPLLPAPGYPLIDRRVLAPRRSVAFRVVAAGLPDYVGMARNLSLEGMGVDARGPVEVGRWLEVRLEPELSAPLTLEAEVRWCHPDGRLGLQFLNLSGGQKQRLRALRSEAKR